MTHTSVEETKRIISSYEFTQWMALRMLEPWGEDWLQAGTIAAAAMNPHIKKPKEAEDFIPKIRKQQSEEEMKMILQAYTSASRSRR